MIKSFLLRIKDSLLFIPSLLIAVGALAAVGAVEVDRELGNRLPALPLLADVTVDGARSLAATVAGATITVASIVFAITALSTQIAANNYSPRAVRGFIEDRFQQVVIGLVMGTFVNALLLLGGLGSFPDTGAAGPRLSVTVTLALGVAAVISIVAYIDHSLRRTRVDAVIQRIAQSTLRAVEDSHPKERNAITGETPSPAGDPEMVRSDRSGWALAINAERLAARLPPGAVARVGVRVGEAVSRGDLLMTVWGAAGQDLGAVRRCFRVGRYRTMEGDPGFGIRQLADIGLRALSPGINDPTTAVDVLHHLKLPLREILKREQGVRIFAGPDGQRVYLAESPGRSDHLRNALTEIRLAANGQPFVLRTLIEVVADLVDELEETGLEGRAGELRQQASLALEQAKQAGLSEHDLAPVLKTADRLGLA